MMFIKIAFTFLFLLVIGTLHAQPVSHTDEIVYYTSVVKQFNEVTPKVQRFWGQLQDVIIASQKTADKTAAPADIAALRSAGAENTNNLNRALRMISALSETDTELSLKEEVLQFLRDIKTTQEASLPGITRVLERGTDKITAAETSLLKAFISKGRELQKREKQFQQRFTSYRFKHNITDAEIDKFVL